VIAVAVTGMGLARSFGLAVVAYLIVAAVRPLYSPLTTGWMVARIQPEIRATALSAVDLFDSGGQILGGPSVGAVGLLASVRVALFAGVAALVPAMGLLAVATRRLRAHR
jgi:MFS transporter, DHA3 family, tetracycline resistance protein